MEVNTHYAKTNLSKLMAAAESGEEVIIARAGKPAVKLVVVTEGAKRSRKAMLGAGVGKIWLADDFDSPATEKEVARLFEEEDGEPL
jgi:prevent-host-death family protein